MKPPQGTKVIYDGDRVIPAKRINGYLLDGPDVLDFLRRLMRVIEARADEVLSKWKEHFGSLSYYC